MPNLMVLAAVTWPGLVGRLRELGSTSGQGAIDGIIAIAVMLVGWGVATLTARIARASLRALHFDGGVQRVLGARTTARHEPAAVAAWLLHWIVIAGASMIALDVLGFQLATSVYERLGDVVPRIVTSAILFAVGSLVALLVGSVTRRFLESADIRAARFQGQIVSAVLTTFAALLALEQLGFAAQFVMASGIVVVAAAGLGLALAFGLGCRDLARDFLIEYLRSSESEDPKRPA